MDRFLEDSGRGLPVAFASDKNGFVIPKVDIAETDAGLELTAELPGFDDKDVLLDIHDGVLTIKAEHKDVHEEKDEKKCYHLVERSHGAFLRRFGLSFEADAEKASAHLEKGLLKVTVPRLVKGDKQPMPIPVGVEKPQQAKSEVKPKPAPVAKKQSKPSSPKKTVEESPK